MDAAPMRTFAILVALAVGLDGHPAATEPPAEAAGAAAAVRKLEREWLDAYEKHDADAMDRIVADDFTITFPDGRVQTKPQLMAEIRLPRKPDQPAPKFSTEGVTARVYGETVVLTGTVITDLRRGGEAVRHRARYTDTYVRRDGRWQVVASHLSNAAEPGPP
jgi:uncharacterized protein (TIGR02246 family)